MTNPAPEENRIHISKSSVVTLIAVATLAGSLFAGFGAGLTAFGGHDKRISSLEESRVAQRERDLTQDAIGRERLLDLRETMKELNVSVVKIAEKVGVR